MLNVGLTIRMLVVAVRSCCRRESLLPKGTTSLEKIGKPRERETNLRFIFEGRKNRKERKEKEKEKLTERLKRNQIRM